MKILMLSTYDKYGGAAIAATRLMHALSDAGTDVSMIVMDKQSEDTRIMQASTFFPKRHFYRERLSIFLANRLHRENLFAVSIANCGADVTGTKAFAEADVIHLHWVNQGLLSLRTLDKIMHSGKPVVWTMHDMWPLTGICHYAQECPNYQTQCHDCPMLYSRHKHDMAYKTSARKREIYENADITFVACSRWLEELGKKSILTKGHTVTNIPNPIDTDLFRPADKTAARTALHLPADKRLLLFNSMKITDKRKGMDYMLEACRILHEKHPDLCRRLAVIVAGKDSQQYTGLFPFPVHCISYISNEKEMPAIYNAADLFVTPSLQDNLPNTIMEAMSCGVPCVGFDIGGIPQMIDHLHNGYVARYRSAEDLANGIYRSLAESDYRNLSAKAREKVLNSYACKIVANEYIRLYSSLTKKEKGT